MKQFIRAAFLCAALSGCSQTLPGDGADPSPILEITDAAPLAERPAARGPDLANTRFGKAVRLALNDGATRRAALAGEAVTASALETEEAALRPSVSLGAQTGIGSNSDDRFVPRVTVTQLIYDGGASRGSIDAAQARTDRAKADTARRLSARALAAARAWEELYLADQLLQFGEAALARNEQSRARMVQRLEAGVGTNSDVLRATSAVAEAQSALAALTGRLSQAETRVKEIFGVLPAPGSLPSPGDPGAGLERNPVIAGLELEARAARRALEVAEARRNPTVVLDLIGEAPNVDDADLRAGVRLDYVLDTSGRRSAAVSDARARLNQVIAELDLTRSELARAAAEVAARSAALGVQVRATEDAEETARAALQDAEILFDTARVDLLDILDLGRALDRARAQRAETAAAARSAAYERLDISGDLLAVLGVCPQESCS